MAEAGFKLRKWLTNDKKLREKIDNSETGPGSNCLQPNADGEESYAQQTLGIGSKLSSGHERVLRLSWDIVNDNFIFEFSKLAEAAKKLTLTKRNILSLLASQFDPMGWIGPIIIRKGG
jgi:hypothetical protein